MPLQRQIFERTKASSPKFVTFVLPGRTTLSEHTPTESIDVTYQTAELSPYLRHLLQHVRAGQGRPTIELRDVDPSGFRIYLEWIATGRTTRSLCRPLLLRDCIDLIYAHIVGSRFEQPHFQDYIIDEMARTLDSAQAPDLKVLEVLFLEKHASAVLRRFIIDRMFALERKMLGMLKGFVDSTIGGESQHPGCEYHVHDNGMCYKHRTTQQTREVVATNATAWNNNEDADLKSITPSHRDKVDKTPFTKERTTTCDYGSPKLDIPRNYSSMIDNYGSRTVSGDINPGSRSDTMYAPDIRYFDSTTRSRDAQGFEYFTHACKPSVELDKPLPPLPISPCSAPLPPARSPSLPPPIPLPPALYHKSAEIYETVGTNSTQDLIQECLGRLSTGKANAPTQDLVAECLGRLSSGLARAEKAEYNSLPPLPSPASSSETSSLDLDLPPSLRPGLPPSIPLLRSSSPTPWTSQNMNTPSSNASPVNPASDKSSYSSPLLTPPYTRLSSLNLPPLIKRKPVPPRGTDWVEQWDRLHALQGTQGFGLRRTQKRERRSRFKKILGSVRRADVE